MAWERPVLQIKSASVGTGVKVGLKRMRDAPAKMSVMLSGAAVQAIGWANDDGIEVMVGTAEHHGLVRLRKNNSVAQTRAMARKLARGSTYVLVPLGHLPMFVNRTESARWCQWEKVEDGWVEIVLPKWADETAPRKADAPTPGPAPRPVTQSRGQSVTALVMGDPPPGRREMLEKMGKQKR